MLFRSILSFVIAGAICACAALAYAEMATMIPASGSAYTYSYVVLGEIIAWVIGWSLILEYSLVVSTVAVGWSGYFSGTILNQFLGIHLPTWLSAAPLALGGAPGGLINLPAVVIALLWLLPPVGFVAALVMLVLIPVWGRTLTERAVISGVVLLGVIAVVFPRAGATPVTPTTARLLLAVVMILLLALRLHPKLRGIGIPRPTLTDGLAALLAVLSGWWLMAAYVGRSTVEIVSGLFFSGWDNHAHYTTFANTYESLSTKIGRAHV